MIANNSSGARSVLYGKTIDHILEQRVVLSDGSLAHFRPLTAAELDVVSAADSLEGACYREVRRLARESAEEVGRRFPKILRRVGGYNLDCFTDTQSPSTSPSSSSDSEGTLAVVTEATIAPRRAAEGESGDDDSVREPSRGPGGDPGHSRARSVLPSK